MENDHPGQPNIAVSVDFIVGTSTTTLQQLQPTEDVISIIARYKDEHKGELQGIKGLTLKAKVNTSIEIDCLLKKYLEFLDYLRERGIDLNIAMNIEDVPELNKNQIVSLIIRKFLHMEQELNEEIKTIQVRFPSNEVLRIALEILHHGKEYLHECLDKTGDLFKYLAAAQTRFAKDYSVASMLLHRSMWELEAEAEEEEALEEKEISEQDIEEIEEPEEEAEEEESEEEESEEEEPEEEEHEEHEHEEPEEEEPEEEEHEEHEEEELEEEEHEEHEHEEHEEEEPEEEEHEEHEHEEHEHEEHEHEEHEHEEHEHEEHEHEEHEHEEHEHEEHEHEEHEHEEHEHEEHEHAEHEHAEHEHAATEDHHLRQADEHNVLESHENHNDARHELIFDHIENELKQPFAKDKNKENTPDPKEDLKHSEDFKPE